MKLELSPESMDFDLSCPHPSYLEPLLGKLFLTTKADSESLISCVFCTLSTHISVIQAIGRNSPNESDDSGSR